jgi:hypothetical protein
MPIARSLVQTAVFGLVLCTAGTPSWAQAPAPTQAPAWPQRTVRLITPLGPGSGMDIAARTFAEKLSQRWGQAVVVENRQGADGIPAVQSMMSDRDNHSLIYGFAGLISINPIIHEKLPYDPARDVVPVASVADATIPLIVSETLKVGSTAEFVALARAKPGQLNWAATTGLPLYRCGAAEERQHRHHPDFLSRLRPRVPGFRHRPRPPSRHRHHVPSAAGERWARQVPVRAEPPALPARTRRPDRRGRRISRADVRRRQRHLWLA